VKKNLTEDMLFSGGIDTSILATIVSEHVRIRGFTCAFKQADALDIKYAKLMAKQLNIEHYINPFDADEVFEAIPNVVKVLGSFDPMEVRNSITIMIGLRFAKSYGSTKLITGDGADELFAGYHMYYRHVGNKEKLSAMLKKMWDIMAFSSVPLGKSMGIEVRAPFLDPDVKAFAMNLDPRYNVQEERGEVWGKWILRKAYEDVLPPEVRWRDKNPIEVGSGTTILPKFMAKRISDSDFAAKKKKILETDKVTIRDKEQLVYYEAYRDVVGVPHPKDPDARTCPQCNSNVAENAVVCRTCGAYPITASGRSITAENAYSDN
jgi:asparagine synthase (glutamine-hydrolysing)